MTEQSNTPPIIKNKKVLIIGGAAIILIVALLALAAIFLSQPSRQDYQTAANDLRDAGTSYNELFKLSAFSRQGGTVSSDQINERTQELKQSYDTYVSASDALKDSKAWRNSEVNAAYTTFRSSDEKVRSEYSKLLASYPAFTKVLSECTGEMPLPSRMRSPSDLDAFKEDFKECAPALEQSKEITFEPYKALAERIKKYHEDITASYSELANSTSLSRISIGGDAYKIRADYNKDLRELSATPEFAKEHTKNAQALQKELNDKIAETK